MTDDSGDNDNVVTLRVKTILDIPVETVLDKAKHLNECVVVGWDKNGKFYMASSSGKGERILMLIHRANHELLHTTADR